MTTDLVLRTLTPGLQRGHLVALLRNAECSGFFDHDSDELRARNDALVAEAKDSFGIFEVFKDGPLKGRTVRSMSTSIQALALMGRLPVVPAGTEGPLEESEHPFLDRPYIPFIIDDYTRGEILDAVSMAGGDLTAATAFLDANHGAMAVIVAE